MKLNLKFKFNPRGLFKKKHHDLSAYGPDTDWQRIFGVFGTLTVLVLLVGLYIFFKVQSGTLFTVQPDPTLLAPRLNITLLNKTASYYQDRGSDFQNIQTSKEVVKDPSH